LPIGFCTAQFDPDHPHRLVQAVGREGEPLQRRANAFKAKGFTIQKFESVKTTLNMNPNHPFLQALRKAKIVGGKGHHWDERGHTMSRHNRVNVYADDLLDAGGEHGFEKVRLFFHSGCRVAAAKASQTGPAYLTDYYRKIFPKAVIVGWAGPAPNTEKDYTREVILRAVENAGGHGAFMRLLDRNQTAVIKALMQAGLDAAKHHSGLRGTLAVYDPVHRGQWILASFKSESAARQQMKTAAPYRSGQNEPIKAGGSYWVWRWKSVP